MRAAFSVSVGEVEEETADRLNKTLEQVAQEKNVLKENVLKLEGDLFEKIAVMKEMSVHVKHLEEKS